MSRYTTELRFVVEQALMDVGLENEEANWPKIWKRLGLADYPIFDESHRDELNSKIVRHYYTREIGAETVGRWRMFVRDAMALIMPYYNMLYASEVEACKINVLDDKGETVVENARGSSESSSTASGDSQNVFSDTPQSELIPNQIRQMKYATNVTIDGTQTEGSGASEYENAVTRKTTGNTRSQAENLIKYRESIRNIDMEVIEDRELRECFLMIW